MIELRRVGMSTFVGVHPIDTCDNGENVMFECPMVAQTAKCAGECTYNLQPAKFLNKVLHVGIMSTFASLRWLDRTTPLVAYGF